MESLSCKQSLPQLETLLIKFLLFLARCLLPKERKYGPNIHDLLRALPGKNEVKIAVFLQGPESHVEELTGFLKNQGIRCRRFPDRDRRRIEEFALFDHGFLVTTNAAGWSFYELRNYIQTYANTWDDDYMLHDSPIHELQTCSEGRDFDHEFYVNLTSRIDEVEDRYFMAGNDIGHFFDGLLKLIRNNLDLYWVAVEYLDIRRDRITYQHHVPSSMDKRDILTRIRKNSNRNIIHREICFDGGEVLARLHMNPGPFSPKRAVINTFLDLVTRHVDDFLHGIISHAREISELHEEIARLKRSASEQPMMTPERERRIKSEIRLILIGACNLKEDVILKVFQKCGYTRIEILSDYKRIKNWDSNLLLRQRSTFDGILLGPMPHSTKGNGDGGNIIQRIINEPERYPPAIEVRNQQGNLIISKSALKSAIHEMEDMLQQVTIEPLTTSAT